MLYFNFLDTLVSLWVTHFWVRLYTRSGFSVKICWHLVRFPVDTFRASPFHSLSLSVRPFFTLYFNVRKILRGIKGEIFSFSLSSPSSCLSLSLSLSLYPSPFHLSLSFSISLSFSLAYLLDVFVLVHNINYEATFISRDF